MCASLMTADDNAVRPWEPRFSTQSASVLGRTASYYTGLLLRRGAARLMMLHSLSSRKENIKKKCPATPGSSNKRDRQQRGEDEEDEETKRTKEGVAEASLTRQRRLPPVLLCNFFKKELNSLGHTLLPR